MDNNVVGLVLAAAALLKVLGSETNDEEEREGTGEEGDVGGMGRIEASSSASARLESFQDEMVADRLSDVPWSVLSERGELTASVFVLDRGSERVLSSGRGLWVCFRCG